MKKCKCCGAVLNLTPAQRKFKKGDIVEVAPLFYKRNVTYAGKGSTFRVLGWNGPLCVRVMGGKSLKSTTRHSYHLSYLRIVKKKKT